LKERDELEELGVDGRIILKLILNIEFERVLIGFIWFRTGNIGRIF
jgi:hypothetical protein